MGAHTLGNFHVTVSFMKYFWTRGEHTYFNNEYYKSIVAKEDYVMQCGDQFPEGRFALIGDVDGQKARVNWKVGGKNGQWINFAFNKARASNQYSYSLVWVLPYILRGGWTNPVWPICGK